ncbi:MAG: hypothetical protein ACREVV_04280 [Steroidobacteraceae bacterium]
MIRTWRTQRYDIEASEIHPDLQAGEDLLRDALSETRRTDRDPAQDDNPELR